MNINHYIKPFLTGPSSAVKNRRHFGAGCDIAQKQPDPMVDSSIHFHLRRQWRFAMFSGVAVVAADAGFLFFFCPSLAPLQGAAQVALVTVYVLFLLRRYLSWNRDAANQHLKARLGAANWITLARGGLLAVLAGFVLQPWPGRLGGPPWTAWMPAAVYMAAVAGDALDGWIARATASQTLLGELLDTRMDALGILTACLLAIDHGQLPNYYLSAGLAYYVLKFAVWLRRKAGRPCSDVKRRRGARVMAGIQMIFLGIVLLPVLPSQLAHVGAVFILIPFLAGFVLDWQGVCRHAVCADVD
jgi:CDP-diacylglycerol--glycerol-3-phosphate 3-phosphatidyltransferase